MGNDDKRSVGLFVDKVLDPFPGFNINAGQGFIEDGGDVHLARNEGTTPVQLYVTFLARPGTTEFLTEVPAPAGCRGL